MDDLSRLARDNHLMLSIIAELHFEGIRVISVADGLDSTDEESTLAIQVRGMIGRIKAPTYEEWLQAERAENDRQYEEWHPSTGEGLPPFPPDVARRLSTPSRCPRLRCHEERV